MSRDVGTCRYCGKAVRDRPLIGTMHLCVSEVERSYIDEHDRQARYQIAAQARVIRDAERGFSWGHSLGLRTLSAKPRVPWPSAQWQRA